MSARDQLLVAGLEIIVERGYEQATVAAIRQQAGVSNGSFFHCFASKEALAGELYLNAIANYHAALLQALGGADSARAGIAALISAHLDWVVNERLQASFLFNQLRGEWLEAIRDRQAQENAALADALAAWQARHSGAGTLLALPAPVLFSQLIGPAQIFCRGWLSGRTAQPPHTYAAELIACACRALLPSIEENTDDH
ncbi:TetR/AcrR family transcriptional regulator [Halopseudomonas pachastrellae]|uniref:TetR/AcrR family transcriptional regulator n=1 Tax=Halopseudomonas pachastrellae TaxID=254161 RepID=UPI003D7E2179